MYATVIPAPVHLETLNLLIIYRQISLVVSNKMIRLRTFNYRGDDVHYDGWMHVLTVDIDSSLMGRSHRPPDESSAFNTVQFFHASCNSFTKRPPPK